MNKFKQLLIMAVVITNVTSCIGSSTNQDNPGGTKPPAVVSSSLANGVCITTSGSANGLLATPFEQTFVYKHGHIPDHPDSQLTSISYIGVESGGSLSGAPYFQPNKLKLINIPTKDSCQVLELKQEYGVEGLDDDILVLNNCKTVTAGSVLQFTSDYKVYSHSGIYIKEGQFNFSGNIYLQNGSLIAK